MHLSMNLNLEYMERNSKTKNQKLQKQKLHQKLQILHMNHLI